MKFSLVLCTINRTREVAEFLASLNEEIYKDFELFIVDQNKDDRLQAIRAPYQLYINIKYFKSAPGLSRARNTAIPLISGDILAFPDDDCIYPAILLKEV